MPDFSRTIAAVLGFLLLVGIGYPSTQASEMSESAPGSGQQPPTYRLVWIDSEFPTVRIDADIHVAGGSLTMFPGLGWSLGEPRGFAAYVKHLDVRDRNGRRLEIREDDATGWRLPGFDSGPVSLSYSVDLAYARKSFSTGNEQVALLEDNALYLTGYAIFITSGQPEDIRIRIQAPDEWEVVTAWREESTREYLAEDYNDFIRNFLAIGNGFHAERLQRHGVDLRIVLFGQHKASAATVRKTFLPIMDFYSGIFRNEDNGQFAFAILPGPNDGEGFSSSFASSQPGRLEDTHKMVWANSLAHEFFHHWNGSRISSAWEHYPEHQWFSEGFTEYYANLALLKTGIIDQRTYDEIMSQYLSMHAFFANSGLFGDISPREAGRKKGLYRPGIYDSGVAIAFCLDGMLRAKSGQPDKSRTLDDFMQSMDRKFGTTGTPIVFDDILDTAAETGPAGTRAFLEEHVSTRKLLPVETCASNMGYDAIIDGYHVFLRKL